MLPIMPSSVVRVDPLIRLQRTLGNQHVAGMLERQSESPFSELLRLGRTAPRQIARQPKPPNPPKEEKQPPLNVAVLLSPDEYFVTLAKAIAPDAQIVHAVSTDDLAKQLKALKRNVGTLYFVAHMDADGDLLFTSRQGTTTIETYVKAETVASAVHGAVSVERLDFRGCNAAQAPAELNKIRVAVNASKAISSNCSLVNQIAGPVKVSGREITRQDQLKDAKVKTAFEQGFKDLHALFVDKKKTCILNDSVDGYFALGGKLIAYWANPGSMADDTGWDDTKSICYNKLKTEKIDPTKKMPVIDENDCKLIELGK